MHEISLILSASAHQWKSTLLKCKQLFEYQDLLLLLEASGGQNSKPYLNALHFFNTRVNQKSVAA